MEAALLKGFCLTGNLMLVQEKVLPILLSIASLHAEPPLASGAIPGCVPPTNSTFACVMWEGFDGNTCASLHHFIYLIYSGSPFKLVSQFMRSTHWKLCSKICSFRDNISHSCTRWIPPSSPSSSLITQNIFVNLLENVCTWVYGGRRLGVSSFKMSIVLPLQELFDTRTKLHYLISIGDWYHCTRLSIAILRSSEFAINIRIGLIIEISSNLFKVLFQHFRHACSNSI